MAVEDCRNGYTYERMCRCSTFPPYILVPWDVYCVLPSYQNFFLHFCKVLEAVFVSYLHVNYLVACGDIFLKV